MPETSDRDRQLPDMATSVITCADVESRDLEAGYLAGRLSADDAVAYEAHYFGCERCWPSLKRATELRAVLAKAAPAPRFRVTPGLAAAAMIVVAFAGWFMVSRTGRDPGTTRGAADSLVVHATNPAGSFAAAWRPQAGADRYRVRLYAADGALLFERETGDTTLALPADSVPRGPGRLFWQVQALDALRQPIARSTLTPAGPTPVP